MGETPLTQTHSTQGSQESIEQIKHELDQATRVQTPAKEAPGMNKIKTQKDRMDLHFIDWWSGYVRLAHPKSR